MIFYTSAFCLLVLLRYALQWHSKARVHLYPFVFITLFLFSAFRFEVGCDWAGYINQWNQQKYSMLEAALLNAEPTWWVLIHGLQSFNLSYPWLNVVPSAIFFSGLHVLARRQPDRLGFLVLLFPILIINMPMSAIAQASAVGLMCIAFAAFIDKKLLSFAAWTLLASTLHNSAIIFILLIPLVNGSYTKKRLFMAVILSTPGFLVLLRGDAAEVATTRYIESDIDAAGAAFRVGLLMVTGLGYFQVLQSKWKRTFPSDYMLVSVGALIMCGFIALVPLSSVISDRFGYYLIPVQTMIFARIPYLPIRKARPFYSAAPYLGLGLVLIVWTSLSVHFENCYAPYQTWLFGLPASTAYTY